jgi:tetratricopeptide (TPR) repeat protein
VQQAAAQQCAHTPSMTMLCDAGEHPFMEVTAAATAWVPERGTLRPKVHIAMQVTAPVGAYGRFAVATAAVWAQSHGHTLSVHGELPGGTASHPTPPNMDKRFGKVAILHELTKECPAPWLLWLDADMFVMTGRDWASDLVGEHPNATFIASQEVGSDGTINTGAVLLRCGTWASEWTHRWWTHPAAVAGRTDQHVLAKLVAESEARLDVGGSSPVVALPATAMNSDLMWWNSFQVGTTPVLHLMNTMNQTRQELGSQILAQACACEYTTTDSYNTLRQTYESSLRRIASYLGKHGDRARGEFGEERASISAAVTGSEQLSLYLEDKASSDGTPGPSDDEAVEVLARALEAAERWDLQGVPTIKSHLADLLTTRKRYKEADQLYGAALQALETSEEANDSRPQGEPHILFFAVLANRAALYRAAGQHGDAVEMLQRVLEAQTETYGRGHPIVSKTLDSMGLALAGAGRFAEAADTHAQAVTISERTLGHHHVGTVNQMANLGVALVQSGRADEGKEVLRRVLDVSLTGTHVADNAKLARQLSNLAVAIDNSGDAAEAIEMHGRALELTIAALGPNHPDTATAKGNLAAAMVGNGQLRESLPLFKSSYDIDRAHYGDSHPAVATDLHNLGFVLYRTGQRDSAGEHFRAALDIRTKALGAQHPETRSTRTWAGRCDVK